MTQTEQIIWHKYLDEKPKLTGWYLGSVRGGKQSVPVMYDGVLWAANWSYLAQLDVIAWAEIPKGWQEEVQS